MVLLESSGAGQACLVGWPECVAPCVAVVAVPGVVAERFAWAVADPVVGRCEDDEGDGVGDSDGAGEGDGLGDGVGDSEGCAGIPITGAAAWTPIRLLPMAAAMTAPTTETGQPKPRRRRPRAPDRSTNTGAGASSADSGSNMSGRVRCADPCSTEVMTSRTLRGLSVQGTWTA
jgi:hypothetical protein